MVAYEVLPEKLWLRGNLRGRDPESIQELIKRLRLTMMMTLCPRSVPTAYPPSYVNLSIPDSMGAVYSGAAAMLSGMVADHIETGGRVLTYCNAGRNRAPLICSLALIKLCGWNGNQAVDHLQRIRPGAFGSNPEFEAYLRAL